MKTAIVTGASGGIGASAAKILSENGFSVILAYNNSDKAVAYAKELNNCIAVHADVSDYSQTEYLAKTVIEKFGRIDVLINNAGVSLIKQIQDTTDEEYNRIFDVNMKGVFNCTKAVLPYMLHSHRGSIVNISSMWGTVGASCEAVYSASKSAVIGFSRSSAKELGPSGIRVNCICPGVINTEMNKSLGKNTLEALAEETPLLRIGTSEDVAKAILFFASDASSFITGQSLGVDGGLIL